MAKVQSNGELVNHFNAVRLRMVGEGNLLLSLFSLDDVIEQELLPLVLTPTTNIEKTRIANFNQQRACLEISIDEIDEWFKINRLVIFVKPVSSGFPG